MSAPESPFDPLARLDPGEDRFVIREKDPVGPGAITSWTHLRRNWAIKTYGTKPTGEAKRLLDAELAQCAEAEEKALTWAERNHGQAAADEQRATYSGAALSEEQVLAARRQKNHASLCQALREAAYHACEMIEQDGPNVDPALVDQHARINELANAIEYGAGEAMAA